MRPAQENGAGGPRGAYPERHCARLEGSGVHAGSLAIAGAATGLAIAGGLLWWKSRSRS